MASKDSDKSPANLVAADREQSAPTEFHRKLAEQTARNDNYAPGNHDSLGQNKSTEV